MIDQFTRTCVLTIPDERIKAWDRLSRPEKEDVLRLLSQHHRLNATIRTRRGPARFEYKGGDYFSHRWELAGWR